jgi:hypothetical protein
MPDISTPTVGPASRQRLVLACCALLPLLTGCYEARYEQRLKTTEQLYHHFELLDRNLSAAWESPTGLKFRTEAGRGGVPKQFTEIPGPPPPEVDEQGKPIIPKKPPPDPRQPDYLKIELPGMQGAWEANLKISGEQEAPPMLGFIYVLSNIGQFVVPEETTNRPDPAKFQEKFVQDLSRNLGVKVKEEDWVDEVYPLGFELVPKVKYQVLKLNPEKPIADAKMTFSLYLNTTPDDVQTFVMFVLPEGVSPDEHLPERISLCLETLRVPPAPAAGSTPTPAATAPSGGF